MRRWLLLCVTCTSCSLRDLGYLDQEGSAGSGGSSAVLPIAGCSSEPGWCELANTALTPECPNITLGSYSYAYECDQVVELANGAIADRKRRRLVLFGGGDAPSLTSYHGNEVYALKLDPPSLERLNDPSALADPIDGCITDSSAPSPRVTFDNLELADSLDALFSFGGSPGCASAPADATWTLDLATLAWTEQPKSGDVPAGSPGGVSDWDPVTDSVFLVRTSDGEGSDVFFRWDANDLTYVGLGGGNPIELGAVGTIDPKLRTLVVIGNGQALLFDLDTPNARHDLIVDEACQPLIDSSLPGLEWDSRHERLVGWTGRDDTIYFLDVAGGSCSVEHHGPPPPSVTQALVTRFRYFPEFDAFVTITRASENAYALRLEP
jgi:hypothetical protein